MLLYAYSEEGVHMRLCEGTSGFERVHHRIRTPKSTYFYKLAMHFNIFFIVSQTE